MAVRGFAVGTFAQLAQRLATLFPANTQTPAQLGAWLASGKGKACVAAVSSFFGVDSTPANIGAIVPDDILAALPTLAVQFPLVTNASAQDIINGAVLCEILGRINLQ